MISVLSSFIISYFIRYTFFLLLLLNFYVITSLFFTRVILSFHSMCHFLFLLLCPLIFVIFLRFANFVKVWECVPKVSFYGNNCHWAARQLVRTSTYENRTGTVTVTVKVIITTVILTFSSLIFHSIIN